MQSSSEYSRLMVRVAMMVDERARDCVSALANKFERMILSAPASADHFKIIVEKHKEPFSAVAGNF
jgi:dihydroneopterin aldolase